MAYFEEKLQEWIVNETNFLSDKSLVDIPDVLTLNRLSVGKHKKIWEYILTHVRSKCAVQKVKRILKLKRDRNNLEKLFPKPANDFNKLHQKIKNAQDKQFFLKSSLANIKKDIVSAEEELKAIRLETDKFYQKNAILYITELQYQEKTAFVNSLHSRLSLHLTDRNNKPKTNVLPLNIEASAKKSSPVISDEILSSIKHLLVQTESLVAKKFCNSPFIIPSFLNVQKLISEVSKSASMCDILLILKEQSKISYVNMIKRLSCNQNILTKSSEITSKRVSEKLLQELKFNYLNMNFSVKKIKNDICKLVSEKGLLMMSKTNQFSDDSEYQKKCQLLDKIAENLSLDESICYLEEMLGKEQTKVKNLKRINAAEAILNEDIVTIQNKFYNDFDTVCLLKNSVPSMLDHIVKCYVEIHKYANEELFSIMSAVLQEFPHELENELKFENEALWNVLRKNDVIKPMLQGTRVLEQSVPDAMWNLVSIAPFQSILEICRNVKLLKDYISCYKRDDWEYDGQKLKYACRRYDKMINVLHEIEKNLNACEENLEFSLNHRSAIQTALDEWWNQSAQFIPDIVYDNKTLKMWIDIVNVADFVI